MEEGALVGGTERVGCAVGSIVSPLSDGRGVRGGAWVVKGARGRRDCLLPWEEEEEGVPRRVLEGDRGKRSSVTVVGTPSSVQMRFRVGVGANVAPGGGVPQKHPSPQRTFQLHSRGTAGQPREQGTQGKFASIVGLVLELTSSLVSFAQGGIAVRPLGGALRPLDRARTDFRLLAARAPGKNRVGTLT